MNVREVRETLRRLVPNHPYNFLPAAGPYGRGKNRERGINSVLILGTHVRIALELAAGNEPLDAGS
jgi:hypothetical protein